MKEHKIILILTATGPSIKHYEDYMTSAFCLQKKISLSPSLPLLLIHTELQRQREGRMTFADWASATAAEQAWC